MRFVISGSNVSDYLHNEEAKSKRQAMNSGIDPAPAPRHAAQLSPTERRRILRDNCVELFGLEAPEQPATLS